MHTIERGGGVGWTAQDIPDQSGRVAVVTGGTSGLGLVSAVELARAGAHVVLTARDAGKGEAALAQVRAVAPRTRPPRSRSWT